MTKLQKLEAAAVKWARAEVHMNACASHAVDNIGHWAPHADYQQACAEEAAACDAFEQAARELLK